MPAHFKRDDMDLTAFTNSPLLIPGALLLTIAVNVFLSWRDRQRQIRIDTARVFFDLLHMTKDTKLTRLFSQLRNPTENIDQNAAAPILYFFEKIATLWHGKTLDENYVKSFYGGELKIFRENESIMMALKETNEQHGGLGCPNLPKLIKHSETW